jgi:hypothetical protein
MKIKSKISENIREINAKSINPIQKPPIIFRISVKTVELFLSSIFPVMKAHARRIKSIEYNNLRLPSGGIAFNPLR